MTWPFNLFGSPEQVRPHDAEREAFLDAKQAMLDKHRIAVVDHRGRRLNERRWQYLLDYLEALE